MDRFVVDFQLRPDVFEKNREFDPTHREMAVLLQTFFVMPVRLSVGGVELFEVDAAEQKLMKSLGIHTTSPWMSVSTLGFAVVGLYALRAVKTKHRVELQPPDKGDSRLTLTLTDEVLTIHSISNGKVGSAPYATAYEAWIEFTRRVLKVILAAFPELGERDDLWESVAPLTAQSLAHRRHGAKHLADYGQ